MSKLDYDGDKKRKKGEVGQSGYDEMPPAGSYRDQARWWREHGKKGEGQRVRRQYVRITSGDVELPIAKKLGNIEGFVKAIEGRAFWKKKNPKDIDDILKLVSDRILKLAIDPDFAEMQNHPVYVKGCNVMADAYERLEKWGHF